MALSLSAEQRSILDILKSNYIYIIPSYQRPYSWEYDQCLQMYTDILEAYGKNEDYFLGNIVLAKSGEKKDAVEVIDGQQRLTSLLLFIKVLSIFCPEYTVLGKLMYWEDFKGNQLLRLSSEVFEADDQHQLKEVMNLTEEFAQQQTNILNKNKTIESNLFLNNIVLFYDWITYRKNKVDDISNITDYLLRSVHMLPIELNDQSIDIARNKALRIFETLNNRGKSLDDVDIFKAKLYEQSLKDNNENAKEYFIETWKEFIARCDDIKISPIDIFKYYSHILRGQGGIVSSEINLRSFFTENQKSPLYTQRFSETLSILSRILDSLVYYNQLNSGENANQWIQLIDKYTNQYPKIATIVFLYQNNNSINDDFLKNLVRYAYYQGSTTKIKWTIYNIIKDIMIGNNFKEFIYPECSASEFDKLGALRHGYAFLIYVLQKHKKPCKNCIISKKFNTNSIFFLDESWSIDFLKEISNDIANFHVSDKSYQTESNTALPSVSSFKNRSNELKELLVKFFRGEL